MNKHNIVLYTNDGAESRSSRRELFHENGGIKNFAKSTGKHLC